MPEKCVGEVSCGSAPQSAVVSDPGCLLIVCSFSLFARRKPNCNQDWQRKLPDFVKRLEEALYRAARSKVGSWELGARCALCAGLVSTMLPRGQQRSSTAEEVQLLPYPPLGQRA